jgi:hypothetical protein
MKLAASTETAVTTTKANGTAGIGTPIRLLASQKPASV